MRKWMRDRMKRRNKSGKPQEGAGNEKDQKQRGPAPLQPTFLDREPWSAELDGVAGEHAAEQHREFQRRIAREKQEQDQPSSEPQPVYEAQPEADPQDHEPSTPEAPAAEGAAPKEGRGGRSRRRGRGGRGRGDRQTQQAPQAPQQNPPVVFQPGFATGEAAEVDIPPETVPAEPVHAPKPQGKKAKAPKGAVVLAIGLPGSGKSSWFRRHNIIPLSSDLVRGLLLDDATEQRYQDLVFSTLRYMLRMRMVAGRPTNYIDATNLSPKERHSWIKMARDFNYEAHAVFFDVPTEICMERNRKRSRNVPDDIMLRMAQKLRPPKFEEGFSKITIVRLKKAEPGSRQDADGLEPEE